MIRIIPFNVSNVFNLITVESRAESRAESPIRRSHSGSSSSSSSCGISSSSSSSSSCGTPCAPSPSANQYQEEFSLHIFDNPRQTMPEGNVTVDRLRLQHLEYIERNFSTIIANGVQLAIAVNNDGYTESSCDEE